MFYNNFTMHRTKEMHRLFCPIRVSNILFLSSVFPFIFLEETQPEKERLKTLERICSYSISTILPTTPTEEHHIAFIFYL